MTSWIQTDAEKNTISGEVSVQLGGSQSESSVAVTVTFRELTPEHLADIQGDMSTVAREVIRTVARHAINS